jgi:hypothetical protein
MRILGVELLGLRVSVDIPQATGEKVKSAINKAALKVAESTSVSTAKDDEHRSEVHSY